MSDLNSFKEAFKSNAINSKKFLALGLVYWFFIFLFPTQVYFILDLDESIDIPLIKFLLSYLAASNWAVVMCFLMQSFYQFKREKQPLILLQLSAGLLLVNNLLAFEYQLETNNLDSLTTIISCLSFLFVISFNHYCLRQFSSLYLKESVQHYKNNDYSNILTPNFKTTNQDKKHAA